MNRQVNHAAASPDLLGLEPPFAETLEPDREWQLPAALLEDAPYAEALEAVLEPQAYVQDQLESEAGTAHSFKGCTTAEKGLLIDAADRSLLAVQHAAAFVGSAHGRPDRMSNATRQLLLNHFHTTERGHLRFILTRLMRIAKALNEGIRFKAERKCKAGPKERVCGYAYTTQLFGGFGDVHICFDKRPGHCDFGTLPPDEQEIILIHEIAHRRVGIEDKAYAHDGRYTKLSASQALDNADSYATFAVEAKNALSEAFVSEDPLPGSEGEIEQLEPLWQPHRPVPAEPAGGVRFPSGLVLPLATGAIGKGEEHWDPNDTGLPLLAAGSVLGEKLSPHFTVRELASSGGVAARVARISPELVRVLELIRDRAGRAVRITSGYRSWKRNRAVYASRGQEATKSRHCSGQAVDCKVAGMTGVQLAKLALDAAGPDLAIGIGGDFIHVDVRGTWTLWTYLKGQAGRDATASVRAYRAALLKARRPDPAPTPPRPSPPRPTPSSANRIVVDRHLLLQVHRGTGPDLVLKWNRIPETGRIDVIVHFHGFADRAMHLVRDKEPISGLDLLSPTGGGGRLRPTLAILPRGRFVGDQPRRNPRAFEFPALIGPGALEALIHDCLQRVSAHAGTKLTMDRLIITGHSGGGAPIRALLAHMDPDEVQILDGMYGSGETLTDWARKRIERDITRPGAIPPSLRVLYNSKSGTGRYSEELWRRLCPILAPAAAARLRRYFRVERTAVGHDDIPRRFGWRLLADAGADLPDVQTLACDPSPGAPGDAQREWLRDPITSTEWSEAGVAEPEWQEAIESEEPESLAEAEGEAELAESEEPETTEQGEELDWHDHEADRARWLADSGEGEWLEDPGSEAFSRDVLTGELTEAEEDRAEPEAVGQGEELDWLDYEAGRDRCLASSGEDEWSEYPNSEASSPDTLTEKLITGEENWQGWPDRENDEEQPWSETHERLPESLEFDTLDNLLGYEAGRGTELADRLKGIAAFTLGPTLRRGSRGLAVSALQRGLITLGAQIAEDGTFGPNTERAVREFQARSGLTPDGIAGPRTKAALAAALGSGPRPAPTPPAPVPPSPTPPRPSDDGETVKAFAERLAQEWNRLSNGRVGAEAKRNWLLNDYAQTLEGARRRFGSAKSEDAIRRAWMISREQQMLFDTRQSPTVKPLGGFGPPTARVPLVANSRIDGSDKAPVAPITVRFADEFKRRFGGKVSVSTYRGHGGGSFRDRGYSLDLFVPGRDGRGFYQQKDAVDLLRAINTAANAVGVRWRVIYNDFAVADAINRELGRRHVIFVGQPRVANGQVMGLNWHGPDPLILHFHLDLAPNPGSEGEQETWSEVDAVQEEGIDREDRSFEQLSALETLFDSEADAGSSTIERLKGVAEFLLGPPLRRGSRGSAVAALQRALNRLGHDMAVDGAFGPSTERAVQAFQGKAGLSVDGIVGPATKAALAAALRGTPPPAPRPAPTPPPDLSGKKLTPSQFVRAFGPSARASEATFRVPALVTLGQAALESGWGEHAPRFNFFGVKAKAADPEDSRQLLRTREVLATPNAKFPEVISVTPRPDGRYEYVVRDWFRAYPNAEASFADHGGLLSKAPRYAKAFTVTNDPYAFATEIARAKYATDPSYKDVLHRVMRTIEKTGLL